MMLLGFGDDSGLVLDSEAQTACDANPNTMWDEASATCQTIGASQATQDSCNINPATYWDPIAGSCKVVPAGSSQTEATQITTANSSSAAQTCNASSATYWSPTTNSCQPIIANPPQAQTVKAIAASSKPQAWYTTPTGIIAILGAVGVVGYLVVQKRKAVATPLSGRRYRRR